MYYLLDRILVLIIVFISFRLNKKIMEAIDLIDRSENQKMIIKFLVLFIFYLILIVGCKKAVGNLG